MEKDTLAEGIYGLLLATNEKIEIVENYLTSRQNVPKSYEEFKELNEEDMGFLIGSLSCESVIINNLAQLYQVKRTAMSILINKETDDDQKRELKGMSDILQKGFENIGYNKDAIEDAIKEIDEKF